MAIRNWLLPAISLVISALITVQASEFQPIRKYRASSKLTSAQIKKISLIKKELDRIYAEYIVLPMKSDDAEKLFLFDRQIEKIIRDLDEIYPKDNVNNDEQLEEISNELWNKQYEKIGLYIGHYSDQLGYSGRLLVEAHKLNPNSRYRRYTLYTTVLGASNFSELVGLPNIKQAYLYLEEFPDGPFVANVNGILATFYHDLYFSLRYGEKVLGMSNSCFAEYISKHPEDVQLSGVQGKGILFYKKVLAGKTLSGSERREYLQGLDSLEKGVADNVLHWCTD